MPLFRIAQGTYTHIEGQEKTVVVAGTSNDTLELTDLAARRLGPTFVRVDEQGSEVKPEPVEPNQAYTEFLAQTLEQIEAALSSMHDPVVLAEIHAVEKEGDSPRANVLAAIDSRYDELQEEHSRA